MLRLLINVEQLLLILLLTMSHVIGGNGDQRMQHSNSSTCLFGLRPIAVVGHWHCNNPMRRHGAWG